MHFRPSPQSSASDDPAESGDDVAEGAEAAGVTGADVAEAGEPSPRPEALTPTPPRPVVVPRWVQLVILPLAILGAWALARAAGPVLLIFVIACVVAILLNPVVKWFQHVLPRGIAIATVYLCILGFLVGVGVLLANPVSTQVNHFADNVPHLVDQANRELASVQRWLNRNGIHVRLQQQGQTALQTLEKKVLKSSGSIVAFSRDLLSKVVQISFDLVLVLVLSIYLLVYAKQIGNLVRRVMPPGDGTPEDDFPLLVQRAVSGYMRGQLAFSFIMGTSAAIALWLFGVTGVFPDGEKYAIAFGAFYGLMEFIPYIGPIIGPLPAVLVALFTDPITAVWVILLFVALQQLEGHFVAPQVFRISLQVNPILIILSLLLGYQLYGIVGALVALPVVAVIRQTVVYLRHHLVLEPWSVIVPAGRALPLETERCPDCGAPVDAGDAYCRACGAASGDRVGAYRDSG
jgi:predicted PurR-regulated permease PerM